MDAPALLIIGAVMYAVILPFAELVALRYGKTSRADAAGWLLVGLLCLYGISLTIPAHAVALSLLFVVLPRAPRAARPVQAKVASLLAARG